MDFDLALLLSSLQNDKEWKSVDVNGSFITNSGSVNVRSNGLFIFLLSNHNTQVLFIPNYTPAPDYNAKKPTAYLQSNLIPKIKHSFVFSNQTEVMNFVNYVYKSNVAVHEFLKKADMLDYLVGDQISGIIPTDQRVIKLMAISQIFCRKVMFQAQVVKEDRIDVGYTHYFSRNSYVSPIFDIPKILKKEKNISVCSFTLFSIDKPKEISYFIAKNESEMIRLVMAFYVSIVYSSNQRGQSSPLVSMTGHNQNNSEDQLLDFEETTNDEKSDPKIKKGKESFNFFEILDKSVLSDQIMPASIKQINRADPISLNQRIDFKSYISEPTETSTSTQTEVPSKELEFDLIQNSQDFLNEDYSQLNFEENPSQNNLDALNLIDQIGKNGNGILDEIQLIEDVINFGVKDKKSGDAWNVFCESSQDELVKVIDTIKNQKQIDDVKKCKTPLQELIRIGIDKKVLHLWILQAASKPEIVQKYFNFESTLSNPCLYNYCAFTIYNFIK